MPPKLTITSLDPKNRTDVMKSRNRRSNFFLTINTNKKFNPHSEEFEEFDQKFRDSLNDMYNNIQDYIKINKEGDTFDDNVLDVDIKSPTEIGPKNESAHSHIMLKFTHNTLLGLDYTKIKEKIAKDLNLTGVYLSNKVYNSADANLNDYIEKYYR